MGKKTRKMINGNKSTSVLVLIIVLLIWQSVSLVAQQQDSNKKRSSEEDQVCFNWNPIAQFDHRLVQFLDHLSNMTIILNSANNQFSSIVETTTNGEDHINQRILELNAQLAQGIITLDKNWKATADNMDAIFKYAGNTLIFGSFLFMMTITVAPLFITNGLHFPKIIEKLHYIAL